MTPNTSPELGSEFLYGIWLEARRRHDAPIKAELVPQDVDELRVGEGPLALHPGFPYIYIYMSIYTSVYIYVYVYVCIYTYIQRNPIILQILYT